MYDVAFSYAHEDHLFVDQISDYLKKEGIKVFYDIDKEIHLWGKNLGDELHEIYGQQSYCVVIFISEHYARKMWTNHERKSVLARAMTEKHEYVLPARFDDAELPGLHSTIGCLDLRKETPESFASKLIQKLSIIKSKVDSLTNISSPTNQGRSESASRLHLSTIRQRLTSAGFQCEDDVSYAHMIIEHAAFQSARIPWDPEYLFCISRFDKITKHSLMEFSSLCFKYGKDCKNESSLFSMVSFAVAIVNSVDVSLKEYLSEHLPPRHLWYPTILEFPVVCELASRRIFYYESSPIWIARLGYPKFRALAREFLSFPNPA